MKNEVITVNVLILSRRKALHKLRTATCLSTSSDTSVESSQVNSNNGLMFAFNSWNQTKVFHYTIIVPHTRYVFINLHCSYQKAKHSLESKPAELSLLVQLCR
jgi:hypothetical protein